MWGDDLIGQHRAFRDGRNGKLHDGFGRILYTVVESSLDGRRYRLSGRGSLDGEWMSEGDLKKLGLTLK